MLDRERRCSRRKFLAQAAAVTLAGGVRATAKEAATAAGFRTHPPRPGKDGRKPIAAIGTVYRSMSHAYHIAGRFIHGYARGDAFHIPWHYVPSIVMDQLPDNDLSREVARDYGIRHCRSIEEALTGSSGKLAVEGVLLIGEHGNYPRNDKGQILYPRFELLEQIVS